MSNDVESVTAWLGQLKTNRQEAAGKIWQRYVEQLVALARKKLRQGPAMMSDEEDVVLSAFDAFFRAAGDGKFPKLDDRDDLWQVLVMLTERRIIASRRRENTLKRGGGKVLGESHLADSNFAVCPEPTPEFAAEAEEQLRYMLEALPTDLERQIAIGKLEGKSNRELAKQLLVSLRTIERKLGIIRDEWCEQR